jgi:TolA-binding protein
MLRKDAFGRADAKILAVGFLDLRAMAMYVALILLVGWLPASEPPTTRDPSSIPIYAASPVANDLFADASTEFNRQRFDRAGAKFQLFLDRYADDPLADYARHYIGVCSLNRGELKDAAETFAKVVRSERKSAVKQESLFSFGWCLFQMGQAQETRTEPTTLAEQSEMTDQAATVFRLFREQYPDAERYAEACFFQAEALFQMKQYGEAQPLYRDVVDNYPQSSRRPDALFGLALVERELGHKEIANRYFDALIKDYPRDSRTAAIYFEIAERSFQAGEYARAEHLYGKVLAAKDHPQGDLALVRQATSLAKLGENDRAAALYEQLPVRFPKSQYANEAWLAAGHHYVWTEKFEKAEACLTKIVTKDCPEAGKAQHWLVRSYLGRGKPSKALEAANAALQLDPVDIVRHNLLLDRADALAEIAGRHNDAFIAYAETYAEAELPYLVIQALQGMVDIGRSKEQYKYISKVALDAIEHRSENEIIIGAKVAHANAQMNLGNSRQTYDAYRELLNDYGADEAAGDWVTNAGWAAVLSEDYEAALELISEYRDQIDTKALRTEVNLITGFALAKLERYDEAIAPLDTVIRLAPESPNAADAMESLVRCLRLTGKPGKAQEVVNRLIQQYPSRRDSAALQLDRAEIAFSQGNESAAEDYYQGVVKNGTDPETQARGLHRLAWISIKKTKIDQAITYLDRLLAEFPEHELALRAHLDRARCYQLLSRHDDAIADLWAFLESKPESKKLQATAVFALGISFIHEERIDDALSAFTTVSETYADYSRADEALYQLGALSHKQGKVAEAIAAFERLVEDYPESEMRSSAKFHLGQLKYDNLENASAIENFHSAIETGEGQPFMNEAYYRLGWAYYRNGEFTQARDAFQAQRTRFPHGDFAHDGLYMLAESQFGREDWSKALTLYEQIVDHHETTAAMQVVALLHQGQAAVELGNYSLAAQSLDRIISEHGESPYRAKADLNLGRCRVREEKWVIAEHHFEKAADLGSQEVAAQARYELAQMYARQEKYDRAIRECLAVMHGLEPTESETVIQSLQAKAGQSAAECATLLASNAATEIERDQYLERAARYWGYVVDEHPNSIEARSARAEMEDLVAHGPGELIRR